MKGSHAKSPTLIVWVCPLKDSRSEKPARQALFTAMQRQMSQNTILILDGMNYIKGFRYQMYCAARELKVRVCTVSHMLRSNSNLFRDVRCAESRFMSWRRKNSVENGMLPEQMDMHTPPRRTPPLITTLLFLFIDDVRILTASS